jgi:hypothetical protein
VKIENKSIQRGSRNYLMKSRLDEYFIPEIVRIFVMLLHDIICNEKEMMQENI